MSNLCVENKITNQIILAYQCRSIFTKIVKNFHYLVRFHNLFKPVIERINSLQINNKAFVGVIHLYQLHGSVFSESFTVNSKNGSLLSFNCIHYWICQLLNFPNGCNHIIIVKLGWVAATMIIIWWNLLILFFRLFNHILTINLL